MNYITYRRIGIREEKFLLRDRDNTRIPSIHPVDCTAAFFVYFTAGDKRSSKLFLSNLKFMKKLFSILIITGVGVVMLSATAQEDDLSKSMARGKIIYEERCVTCHMADGKGIPSVFPPLAESDYLLKKQKDAIRAIKFGQEGEITVNGTTYNNVMAPQGLSDGEVADVMNYILNSWGNKGKMVTPEAVAKVKE